MTASTTSRELACLALGHDDAAADRCPSSDDDLIRQLVDEVQALRVAAGIVEETPTDRAEQIGAVEDALADAERAWATGRREQARILVEHLAEQGYRLIPAARP